MEAAVGTSSRWDAALFGERQSRIVVSVDSERTRELEALAQAAAVPAIRLGETGGDRFRIDDRRDAIIDLPVSELTLAWSGGLEAAGG